LGFIYFDSGSCVLLLIFYTTLQHYCTSSVNTACCFLYVHFFRFLRCSSVVFTVIQHLVLTIIYAFILILIVLRFTALQSDLWGSSLCSTKIVFYDRVLLATWPFCVHCRIPTCIVHTRKKSLKISERQLHSLETNAASRTLNSVAEQWSTVRLSPGTSVMITLRGFLQFHKAHIGTTTYVHFVSHRSQWFYYIAL
jgi:hypothetical protein